MADLSTRYLGLELEHPLVPSASPLSRDLDTAKRLEDAGASALVMYSLFEEEVRHEEQKMLRFMHEQDIGHAEAETYLPMLDTYASELDDYLEQLAALKSSLNIPVIASLNGISLDGWIEHGKLLQEAGADALELNVYYVAADAEESSAEVEGRYVQLLRELKHHVTLPITMKLSPQFSSVTHMVKLLESAGADGVVLFNRFYQPNIDLDTLEVSPTLELSSSAESLLRIRWVAILYGQVNLSLAVTGGMHTVEDVLKALLAGADVTHLCSALLLHGPHRLTEIRDALHAWLADHEYESVQQLKGSVSRRYAIDPVAFERANYINVLDTYTAARGVRR
ncbi:MAG: dihydroorotate dehydrogenase-like protein [Gammaproteobacteria bacterium]